MLSCRAIHYDIWQTYSKYDVRVHKTELSTVRIRIRIRIQSYVLVQDNPPSPVWQCHMPKIRRVILSHIMSYEYDYKYLYQVRLYRQLSVQGSVCIFILHTHHIPYNGHIAISPHFRPHHWPYSYIRVGNKPGMPLCPGWKTWMKPGSTNTIILSTITSTEYKVQVQCSSCMHTWLSYIYALQLYHIYRMHTMYLVQYMLCRMNTSMHYPCIHTIYALVHSIHPGWAVEYDETSYSRSVLSGPGYEYIHEYIHEYILYSTGLCYTCTCTCTSMSYIYVILQLFHIDNVLYMLCRTSTI